MALNRFSLAFFCLFSTAVFAATPTLQEASQLMRQGKPAQALDSVNAYLASNTKDAQGRFLKGLILTELNRFTDAIKVFSELTDDYPELPEPYNNLAVLYAAQGQYERAKNSLEMAIRTHPSYATAHENLGDIYAKMASQSYDKALQLDKSNVSAQTKLSLIKDLFSPGQKTPASAGQGATKVASANPGGMTATASKPTPEIFPSKGATGESSKPVEPKKPAEGAKPATASKPAESAAAGGTPAMAAESAVRAWADAWARQDVDAYLAAYAADYAPPRGQARADWETQRRDRISKPAHISVQLVDLKVVADPVIAGAMKVYFRQLYASDRYRDATDKVLTLQAEGEQWKILSEE